MHNPGSPEATGQGCTCPVLDNNRGEGIMYRGRIEHWINSECPLHNPSEPEDSVLSWGSDINMKTGERMENHAVPPPFNHTTVDDDYT